jgi:hypothetical protein
MEKENQVQIELMERIANSLEDIAIHLGELSGAEGKTDGRWSYGETIQASLEQIANEIERK